MAWLRLGDSVATHPIVTAVLDAPDADDRSVDEVFGYTLRLWTQAAQHPHATDYVAPLATAVMLAGSKSRAENLLALAEFAGYGWVEVDDDTGRRRFRFVDDPKFVHMKTQEQIDSESQRRIDIANPNVTTLVRFRDGDACRYCADVVDWSDRRGAKGGTYDHRPPGRPATPDTMVVACKSCNSQRGALQQTFGITDADELLAAIDAVTPLLPPPHPPYYKPATCDMFERNAAILRTHGLQPPAKPARRTKPIPAGNRAPGAADPTATAALAAESATTSDPAPHGVRSSDTDPAPIGVRPVDADTAPDRARPDATTARGQPPGSTEPGRSGAARNRSRSSADRRYPGSGVAGSGRDGSGQVGTGGNGSHAAGRRRRRRGRRGRNQ